MSLWLELEQAGLGDSRPLAEALDAIPWNADGLIAAIAQQHDSGEVLAEIKRAGVTKLGFVGNEQYSSF